MRNEEIKSELSALRAEVVALAEAREKAAEPEPPREASTLSTSTGAEAPSDAEHEGFVGQVQELVELLENELRETPVVSGLVIFSIGILVGRFLR
ncbi:MAG: hypothetical protein OES69_12620 [Myxococcales bacterium]|nr:hypothetical protein [Myxococcales bacterium]MDH3844778.1 hypothetical protein [Myxococcales bacterium]